MAVHDDVNGWTAEPYQGNGEFYMGYADDNVSVTVPGGWSAPRALCRTPAQC